jgi:amino acid adenylation domain-containing protein
MLNPRGGSADVPDSMPGSSFGHRLQSVREPAAAVVGSTPLAVHELFEQRAALAPEDPAVRCDGQHLTCTQLNLGANQLAHELIARGVGLETPVGICIEPSIDAVIAVLATLKAGGAYVVLPTPCPVQRLNELIRASAVPVIIAAEAYASRLATAGVSFVCIDRDADAIAQRPTTNPRRHVQLEHVAFVRYTLATRPPKGVLGTHRSLVAGVGTALPGIRPGDVSGADTTFEFGPRVFHPLLLGAPLVLVPDGEMSDPAQIVRRLAEERVTSMFMSPTQLRRILALDTAFTRRLAHMRAITVGGELLMPDVIERFSEVLPGVALINEYGSVETGVASLRVVAADTRAAWRSLGQPIVDTRVYVLDELLRPVPAPQVGEIYVRSPHLARGYMDDPRATAERFMPDPFGNEPGQRLHRTGDLGRVIADSSVEFLGRVDQAITIGGSRFQATDVEATLLRHPDVREAVVTLRHVEQGSQLVACIVPSEGIQPAAVRAFLRDELPPPMVPSVFEYVDALPVTGAGRIDRAAVERPPVVNTTVARGAMPPTALEASLSAMVAALLGVDGVGPNDDFFALGGDSLLATRLALRVRHELARNIPGHMILEMPTVRQMAVYLETNAPVP